MALGAAERAAMVGQHSPDRQVELAAELQHVDVPYRHRGVRLLADVEEAERMGAKGVHNVIQVVLGH